MSDFIKYMINEVEERNLRYRRRMVTGIVVFGPKNDDKALEIISDGSLVSLYYFSSFTNDAMSYWDDKDLSDPDSIDWIMEWLDKLK